MDPSKSKLIDKLCDAFEKSLSSGASQNIPEIVNNAADDIQQELLKELLLLEREIIGPEAANANVAQYIDQLPKFRADLLLAIDDAEDSDATKVPNSSPSKESQHVGPYKLQKIIGEGGMGSVWLAEQKVPVRRRVALKIIKRGLDSKEVIARFESERQALAMMDHPCIAKILDAGTTENGSPYFAMELVNGNTLTTYCDDNQLSLEDRLKLFTQICDAVQHAHQKGILHRDLKPANILVTEVDGQAVPKVIDFGLAKALESSQRLTDQSLFTEFGQVLGTLKYMSPEQAGSDSLDIDTRSDIFALGVILYELLTGSTPLNEDSLKDKALLGVLEMIREQDSPRPSHRLATTKRETLDSVMKLRRTNAKRFNSVLHGDLDWIVMKALERNRNRRYETANAFAKDINHFLNDEPVTARKPSTSYLVQKFVKKHKVLVTAASLVAICLTAGIIGTTSGFLWALDEREKATKSEERAVKLATEKSRLADEKTLLATAETEAKNVAQATAKRSQTMLQIVASAFDSATPSSGADATTLAKDVLIQAKTSLDNSDLDDEGRRDFLEILTNCFQDIGEYPEAVSMAKRLADLTSAEPDASLELVLKMRLLHSEALISAGQPRQALSLLEPAITESKEMLGESHLVTLGLENNYALSLMAVNRTDDAIAVLERCVKLAKENHGESRQETLELMNSLAAAFDASNRITEAVALHRKILALRSESLGADHPKTLVSMSNLAISLETSGDFKSATNLLKQTYELRKQKLGEMHPDTVISLAAYADVFAKNGKIDKAVSILRKTLKTLGQKLGEDHPSVIIIKNNLACSLDDVGELEDAIRLHEEVLAWRQIRFGKESEQALASNVNLASAHRRSGQMETAIALNQDSLEIAKRTLGPTHSTTVLILNNLGYAYGMSGNMEKAVPIAEQVLKIREETLPMSHPDILAARNNLAAAYGMRGRTDDAIKILEKSHQEQISVLGEDHIDTLVTASNLAVNYSNAGRRSEAIALKEQIYVQRKKMLGPSNSDTMIAGNNLAFDYSKVGRLPEAIALYKKVMETRQKMHGASHSETLTAKGNLAAASKVNDQVDQAIQLYQEVLEARQGEYGAEHPSVFWAMRDLANTLSFDGQSEKAIELAERLVARATETLGAEDQQVLACKYSLGGILIDGGEFENARTLLEEVTKTNITKLGASHIGTLSCMDTLAKAYRRLEKFDSVEATYREALKQTQKSNTQLQMIQRINIGLARACFAQGKAAEAERILKPFIPETSDDNQTPLTIRQCVTLELYGRILIELGRVEEADQPLHKAYAGLKKRLQELPKPDRNYLLKDVLTGLVDFSKASGRENELQKWTDLLLEVE